VPPPPAGTIPLPTAAQPAATIPAAPPPNTVPYVKSWQDQAFDEIARTPGLDRGGQRAVLEKYQAAAQGPLTSETYLRQTNEALPIGQRLLEYGVAGAKGLGKAGTAPIGLIAPGFVNDVNQRLDREVKQPDTWGNFIAVGLGGALPMLATAGAASPFAAATGMGALSAAGGARQEVAQINIERARAGLPPVSAAAEVAGTVGQGLVGGAEGYTEGLLMALPGRLVRGVSNPLLRGAAAVGTEVAGEAAQNVPAHVAGNTVAAATYDPGRDVTHGWERAALEGAVGGLAFGVAGVRGANAGHRDLVGRQIGEAIGRPAVVTDVRQTRDTVAATEIVRAAIGKDPVWFYTPGDAAARSGGSAYFDPKREQIYLNAADPTSAAEEAYHALFRDPSVGPELRAFATENPDAAGLAAEVYGGRAAERGRPDVAAAVAEPGDLRTDEGVANFGQEALTPDAVERLAAANPAAFVRTAERVLTVFDKMAGTDTVRSRLAQRRYRQFVDPLRRNLDAARAKLGAEKAGQDARREERFLDAVDPAITQQMRGERADEQAFDDFLRQEAAEVEQYANAFEERASLVGEDVEAARRARREEAATPAAAPTPETETPPEPGVPEAAPAVTTAVPPAGDAPRQDERPPTAGPAAAGTPPERIEQAAARADGNLVTGRTHADAVAPLTASGPPEPVAGPGDAPPPAGAHLAEFARGDVVEATLGGAWGVPQADGSIRGRAVRFEVVAPDVRGMTKLRNLETGKVEQFNAWNNRGRFTKVDPPAPATNVAPPGPPLPPAKPKRAKRAAPPAPAAEPQVPQAAAPPATSPAVPPALPSAPTDTGSVGDTPSAPTAAAATGFGDANKVFTKAAFEDARAKLREKLNRLNSIGPDPEMISLAAQVAGFYVEGGVRSFSDFARTAVREFGDRIKPYLKLAYNAVRDYPGMERVAEEMDDYPTVKAASLDEPAPDSAAPAAAPAGTLHPETSDAVPEPPTSAANADDGDAGRRPDARPESDRVAGAGGRGAVRDGDVDGARGGTPPADQDAGGRPAGGGALAPGVRGSGGGGGRKPGARRDRADGSRDYRAPLGGLKRQGSWHETAARNVEIIKLVKQLDADKRRATPEEQAELSLYTGFGATEIANGLFPRHEYNLDAKWRRLRDELTEILTPAEMKTLRRSTQYAHYTSEGVIRGIWRAAERLGFTGGSVLEPGAGIGLFPVAAPQELAENVRYVGVEMDHLTAAIARHLLPEQTVIQKSYVDQSFPDDFFDAAFGNPPFASTEITADPAYRKYAFLLHDYFFAKTVDKVRPGGLVTFVTSKGTMDKQTDKARQYLAGRADLVGAIRLPQTAFMQNAGTEVVTDVLFFRKRMPGEKPAGEEWLASKPLTVNGTTYHVNEYFHAHPEMVLGEHSDAGSMYGAKEYTVKPRAGTDPDAEFDKAVERLPKGVYTEKAPAATHEVQAAADRKDFDVKGKKEGGLYLADDGALMQVVNGVGKPYAYHDPKAKGLTPAQTAFLKDYVPLRDALKQAMADQLADGAWEKSHAALVKRYRAFVKRHGRLLEHTQVVVKVKDDPDADAGDEPKTRTYRKYKWNKLLSSAVDVEMPLTWALETLPEEGTTVTDGAILKTGEDGKPLRVLAKRQPPKIETVNDAYAVSLNELGRLNLDHVAELTNQTRDQVIDQLGDLIFEHPTAGWQQADEYLSGNVLEKLEHAQAAAATDPDRYQRNVDALLKVQPAPLGPDRISVRLGANWIPANDVARFAREVLGVDQEVTYNPRSNIWLVAGEGLKRARAAQIGGTFSTADRSAGEILQAVLSNGELKVTRTEKVGSSTRTWVDKDATAAVTEAADQMRQRFAEWIWQDAERAGRLLDTYNRTYNNLAPRAFDGRHMTFPGLSLRYKLYDHQKRAIWRVVQTGNTYLNHAVGAGKTLEMIVSAMEQKRLGLVRKPMFVVPNHMLEQFGNEFMQAYPAARILVADKDNFTGDQRRRFVAQAAGSDWDAVIVKQSSFKLLAVTEETAQTVADDVLDELRAALDDLDAKDQGNRVTIKKIEAQIERVEQRVAKLAKKDGDGKDDVVLFEELGVDFLYVDEAHLYRKLDFATNRKVKGIDPNGSDYAFDLFAKLRWLNGRRKGRSVVLASGTPVTNTLAEMYTIQRYMDYDGLRAKNLHAFDAWANQFGAVKSDWERNGAGDFEKVDRFAKFVNVPVLMEDVRRTMDVLTMDQLGELVPRPRLKGGKPDMRVAPISDRLSTYMKTTLKQRLATSKAWKPSKEEPGNPDPIFNIAADGSLAALDMRYVDPELKDDPGSKLNLMIERIIQTYKASKNNEYHTDGKPDPVKGGTQIVFSVTGFGDAVTARRGFDARAWMLKRFKAAGIPAEHVAFMSDADTDAKKEQLFKEMRAGQKRILVGSPMNMGTGVNVQKRLVELHFLAPPWYPSDVEQPHGRILRQGNQNKEVEIGWYVTEGTYDATKWGMVRRKGAAIEQAFRGDKNQLEVEDISEVSQYTMAEAVASGDDRVVQLAEYGSSIEKLTRLQNAHFGDQQQIRQELESSKSNRRFYQQQLKKAEAALAAIADADYWAAEVLVDGKKHEKVGDAGAAMVARIADLPKASSRVVAKVGGHEFRADRADDRIMWRVKIGEHSFDAWTSHADPADINDVTLGQRAARALGLPRDMRDNATASLKGIQKRIDELTPKMGAPFPRAGELADAVAKQASLHAELLAESRKTEDVQRANEELQREIWRKNAEEDAEQRRKNKGKGGGEAAADDDAPRMAFGRGAPPAPTVGDHFALSNESTWEAVRRVFQDEFRPVTRMQDDLRRQGAVIGEDADVYLKTELFKGRAATRIAKLEEEYVRPIVERMTAAGLTLDDVDRYLYALHAPERNAQVATVNPAMPTGGSGMTDERAAEIVDEARASGKLADYDAIADLVHRMNDQTLDLMVDAGLLDAGAAGAIHTTYRKYVPLRTDMEDDGFPNVRPGRGFDVRGKDSVRAAGRASMADSPLTFSLMQAQEKIVRAEKNRVAQAMLRLVTQNPDPRLWAVDPMPTKRIVDPRTGLARDVPDRRLTEADHVVAVKVAGKTHLIEFKGEAGRRIAGAMKRLNFQDGGAVVRWLGRGMRVYASLQTNLNPEFILPNMIRDVQTAGINLSAERGRAMALRMVRAVPKAWRAVFDVSGDRAAKPGSAYHDYMREYLDHGGKVDAYSLGDFDRTGKRIETLLKDANPTKARRLLIAAKKAGAAIDRINGATETATRLAAYAEARKAGLMPERAASLAKNLTVNFNRKGEVGTAVNALYLFANASLQGNVRFAAAMLKTRRGRQVGAGILLAGLAYGLLAPELFGEDEEGRDVYDTIPDPVKGTNLVLPAGGTAYAKVPLPYGFNSLFSAGRLLGETVTARKAPAAAAADLLVAGAAAFNPLGQEGSFLQTLAPTALDPFVQIAENRDWAGQPIVPGQPAFGPRKPDSELAMRDTSAFSRAVARWLNDVTGGDEVASGAVDVSPATLDHWMGWAGGGTGRFVNRVADLPARVGGDGELRASAVPVANRFVGQPSETINAREFRDVLAAAEDAGADLRHYEDAGKDEDAQSLRESASRPLRFARWAAEVRKQGTALRAKAEAARARGDDDAAAEAALKALMHDFVVAYRRDELPREWATENERAALEARERMYRRAREALATRGGDKETLARQLRRGRLSESERQRLQRLREVDRRLKALREGEGSRAAAARLLGAA
jgi:N12 class adenine-specific DNA methylase/predicted RNA methylase